MSDAEGENSQVLDAGKSPTVSLAKGATFMFVVSAASILGGVALTIGKHKKGSGAQSAEASLNADGAKLALKALGYGTVCSVSGFALMIIAVRKMFDIRTMEDFDQKMKNIVPQKDSTMFESLSFMKLKRNDSGNDESSKEW